MDIVDEIEDLQLEEENDYYENLIDVIYEPINSINIKNVS